MNDLIRAIGAYQPPRSFAALGAVRAPLGRSCTGSDALRVCRSLDAITRADASSVTRVLGGLSRGR